MTAGGFRYELRILPAVTDLIATRSEAERMAVHKLVNDLRQHPRSRTLLAVEVRGIQQPGVWTAPIRGVDDLYGYLDYEIYADYPAIHVFHVVFWEPLASAP